MTGATKIKIIMTCAIATIFHFIYSIFRYSKVINHNIIELIFSDIGNKKIKKLAVKHLFGQHTTQIFKNKCCN